MKYRTYNEHIAEMAHTLKTYEAIAPDDTRTILMRRALETARPVKCVRAADVLDDDVIEYIKYSIQPRKHECWRNASLFADEIPGAEYVEGIVWCPVAINHAFNFIEGHYIDITMEFVLNEDPREYDYTKVATYDEGTRRNVRIKTGEYCSIFEFLNSADK